MFKKIITNTFIYSVAPYVASIANLLVLPIITKDLTEVDYGISGTITAYTSALSALSVLGLSVIVVNSYFQNKNRYKWIWRQIYGFLIIWNIIYSIFIAGFLYIFMPHAAAEYKVMIISLNVLPIVFFGPTNFLGTFFYTLQQKAIPIGIRTAIFGILAVFLNLLFISYYKLGYMGWFYTNFIIGVLTNISYWYILNIKHNITPIYNFKQKTIYKYLKISIPLLPHQYSYYLLNGSERLIMDQVKISTNKIGEFNIASMFSNYVSNFAQAGSTAIGPIIMDFYTKKKFRQARNIIFIYQTLLLGIDFIICLWAKEAFYFLISNEILRNTYDLAIILIMAISFTPLFVGYYSLLTFHEKTKRIWRITFSAGIICIVLNLIFLPVYGILSAPIIIFISYMYRGLSGYYLKSFKIVNSINYFPMLWTFSIIIFTIIVYLLKDIELVYKAFITFSILILMIPLYMNKMLLKQIFID